MLIFALQTVNKLVKRIFIKWSAFFTPSGNVKKKEIFKDIIQNKVDHPPSYPIFDKLFFDKF